MPRVAIDAGHVFRLLVVRASAVSYTGSEFRFANEDPPQDSNYSKATLLPPEMTWAGLPRRDDQPDTCQLRITMLFEPSVETATGGGLYRCWTAASEAMRDMTATDIDDSAGSGHTIRWTGEHAIVPQADQEDPRLFFVTMLLTATVTRTAGSEVNP